MPGGNELPGVPIGGQRMARARVMEVRPGIPAAQISLEERMTFVRRIYGWMSAALLVAFAGAAIAIKSGMALGILQTGFLGSILMVVAWIGLAFVVQKVRHVPTWNVLAFAAYALFTGFVISSIVYVAMLYGAAKTGNAGTYVFMALGGTVAIFGTLSVYAMTTKRDFSFMGGMLMVLLVVLILGGVVNIFVESIGFGIFLASIGVLVFSGFILYDTQKILRTYPSNEHVAASMTLFLNFVLLFVEMLRLILLIASSGDD
jgi:modulator of FtsH protease